MHRDDIDAVADIEAQTYDFPWSSGIFRDCLRVGYRCRVLERDGRVAGYGILSTAAGEAHILNLCLHPELRGGGFGRMLLTHLTGLAELSSARQIFLEVRPSNLSARKLYAAAGFNEIGRRPDYYRARHGREDALVLARELLPPP